MGHNSENDHPLVALREALNQTRTQFAASFGVSRSLIEKIESRNEHDKRTISDELCAEISSRVGVVGNSLKKERGLPEGLLREEVVALMKIKEREPILKELRALRNKPRERLRYQIQLWKLMLPTMEENAPRKEIMNRLFLFLDAALHERKHFTALTRLNRWIEQEVENLNLHASVKFVARKRGVKWQARMPARIMPIELLASAKLRRA